MAKIGFASWLPIVVSIMEQKSPSSIKKSRTRSRRKSLSRQSVFLRGNTFPHGITLASFTWSKYVTQSASVHSGIGDCTCAGAVPLRPAQPGNSNRYPFRRCLNLCRGQPLFMMTVQRAHWSFTPGPRVGLGNQWSLPGADYPRPGRATMLSLFTATA